MPYDYGFDLPDQRYSYYDKSGQEVQIWILRDWRMEDEYGEYDEPRFDVRWKIVRGSEETLLPKGLHESKAIEIAEKMYPVDRRASRDLWELRAEEEAERRMGA